MSLGKYREYIIPGVIALLLIIYIGFRDDNRINYKLPEPAGIEKDEIRRITLEGPDTGLEFIRRGNDWYLMPENWKADPAVLSGLVSGISDPVPADLISSSGNLQLYELDKDSRCTVKAFSEDSLLRELYAGKVSASGIYTYVMFPGDSNVYSIRGNLPSSIPADRKEIRDKKVLTIMPSDIGSLVFTAGGVRTRLSRDENNGWKTEEGSAAPDSEAVSALLPRFNSLRCVSFLDEKMDTAPRWELELYTGETAATLALWPEQNGKYPARVSGLEDDFLLSSYTSGALLNAFGVKTE